MSLLDTADGVVMNRAYGWAFSNPCGRSTTASRHEPLVRRCARDRAFELLQVTVGLRVLVLGKVGYLVFALFATWAHDYENAGVSARMVVALARKADAAR